MGKWKNRLFQFFDLPPEVTSEEPRIEWMQRNHLQIENHQGIQFFSKHKLKVLVKNQVLSVIGSQLSIQLINSYTIKISGNIETIQYAEKGGSRT